MTEWIKTADRMPENEDVVLVRTKRGDLLHAWWKGVGWKCGHGVWVSDVVAWRQL